MPKVGDFVEIEFVGKVKESGEIFDLTDEALAKEKKIYNPRVKYGPVMVVLGGGYVLKGLDLELQKMKPGEKKVVALQAEQAFGPRDPNFVKVFPFAEFKKEGKEPKVGQWLSTDRGLQGKIVSIAGGRVSVDFNHPLAGKALEYDVKMNRIVTDKKEQIGAVLEFFTGLRSNEVSIEVKDKKVAIDMPPRPLAPPTKARVAEDIARFIGINETAFVESFKVPPQKEKVPEETAEKAESTEAAKPRPKTEAKK